MSRVKFLGDCPWMRITWLPQHGRDSNNHNPIIFNSLRSSQNLLLQYPVHYSSFFLSIQIGIQYITSWYIQKISTYDMWLIQNVRCRFIEGAAINNILCRHFPCIIMMVICKRAERNILSRNWNYILQVYVPSSIWPSNCYTARGE